MLASGRSGFGSAPVTRAVFLSCAAASLACLWAAPSSGVSPASSALGLSLEGLARGQVYRLFTANWPFSTAADTAFGLATLYAFRLHERQMGSRKFGGLLAVLCAVSTALQLAALAVFGAGTSANGAPHTVVPGPYAVVFGLLPCYFLDVPQLHNFRICGLPLSDKSVTYLCVAQLMAAVWPHSLLPAGAGLLAGLLLRSNLVPALSRVRAPRALVECCRRYVTLGGAGARRRRGYARVDQQGAEMHAFGAPDGPADDDGFGGEALLPGAAGLAAPAPPPSEEAVASLVAMGFDEGRVRVALATSHNDVELAMNRLLDS